MLAWFKYDFLLYNHVFNCYFNLIWDPVEPVYGVNLNCWTFGR